MLLASNSKTTIELTFSASVTTILSFNSLVFMFLMTKFALLLNLVLLQVTYSSFIILEQIC